MENIYKSKVLFVALLLMTSIAAWAQIPNPGFETWTSGSCTFNSYNNPTDWGTINSLTCILGSFTCIEAGAAEAHSGSHALELTTVSTIEGPAPGIVCTGTINQSTQAVEGGFSLTTITHPDKLIGWYKYAPSPPDTFSVSINVYSGLTTGTIIGQGSLSGSAAVSTYTRFIVNIPYTSSGNGDSAQITIINSAGATGQPGTTMYVDDLSLVSCSGFGSAPTVTNANCATATGGVTLATPVNGTAPYTYSWSNNATGASISNLLPGTYKVTVTDFNTCTAMDSVVVAATNVPFTVNTTGSTTSCVSNTGTVTATPSLGNSPYTYSWSNNGTAAEITGLGAGNFTVTVTDAHGCTTTASGSVTTPNGPSATDVTTNPVCYGDSTGTIIVSVTGGASPITYSWNNTATTVSLTGVPAGTYTLTITDNNSCSFEVSATITQPTALSLSGSGNDTVACYNDSTGVLSASASGGTPNYTYWWSNGNENSSVPNLPAGNYWVYVTDANACTSDTVNLAVVQPTAVQVSLTGTNASSPTASDGTDIAVASGGTGMLTLNWNTGANQDTITHLSTATYCVTVTDVNFCSVTACDSVGFDTVSTIGIKTIPSTEFKIYPNPASSQLTIETNTANGKFGFSVYSLDGKLVEQLMITSEKSVIELNQIADGFYTYQLKDMIGGGVSNGKLEIQR